MQSHDCKCHPHPDSAHGQEEEGGYVIILIIMSSSAAIDVSTANIATTCYNGTVPIECGV